MTSTWGSRRRTSGRGDRLTRLRRTDLVVKRDEYADAGIPHYWILDLTEPVSLLVMHRAGDMGYAVAGEFTGRVTVAEPFPADLDLDILL